MVRLVTLLALVQLCWATSAWAGEPRKATDYRLDLPKARKAPGAKTATDLKLELPKKELPGGAREATDLKLDLPSVPLALDGDKPLNATKVNLGKSRTTAKPRKHVAPKRR